MPIVLPNLDDRRYADLVDEALAMIPVHAPEWTNHNASDPGITLVEMLAYLTEILLYRLDRVTVENVVTFLNLIDAGGRRAADYHDRATLTEEVRKVVTELRKPYRAVTYDDYNRLVVENFGDEVARAFTMTRQDKRKPDNAQVDFVSVFIVPVSRASVLVKRRASSNAVLAPGDLQSVKEYGARDVRNPGNIPFQLVSSDDEYLYIGMESKFDAIMFNLKVTGSGYSLRFEYSQGGDEDGDWPMLTAKDGLMDLTSNWASSGLVVFAPPEGWKQSTVNKKPMYWIRVLQEVNRTGQIEAHAYQVAVLTVPALESAESYKSLPGRVKSELDKRKLLTTRLSVKGMGYKPVAVQNITLHLTPGALQANVIKAALEELSRFFHPLIGWRDGRGWPFGRNVYLSEVIERLAGLAGVDYVVSGDNPLVVVGQATPPPDSKKVDTFIQLDPFELVDFRILETRLKTESAPDPRSKPAK